MLFVTKNNEKSFSFLRSESACEKNLIYVELVVVIFNKTYIVE